jgi:hypothetical protein
MALRTCWLVRKRGRRGGDLLWSCTTSFVTPRAVSVVICIAPRCRVGKPKLRSSAVRSVRECRLSNTSLPERRISSKCNVPLGGSSPKIPPNLSHHLVNSYLQECDELTYKNQSNSSLSSMPISFSALGSNKHTLFISTPSNLINSLTLFVSALNSPSLTPRAARRDWRERTELGVREEKMTGDGWARRSI